MSSRGKEIEGLFGSSPVETGVVSDGSPEIPGAVSAEPLLSDGPSPGMENEGPTPAEVANVVIRRQRARKSLISFAQEIDDNYAAYSVHYHIAARLEQVEAGKIRRLAIFVPPAIGKSRLASELFPAWCYGKNPSYEIIAASYNADLATGFGRNVRNTLLEPEYGLIFPETVLSHDSTAADEWKTEAEGEYKAEGVGGGLVGFHANIAIIDDPFKDYAAAASARERSKVWDWYSGVLLNRLRSYREGIGAVILIMQRWHDDDLGGRVEKLSQMEEEAWEIVNIPSIAEDDDPLERKPGEALLPEGPNQRTTEELEQIRSRHPGMFMAVHQQKPIAEEGDMFKDGDFRRYRLEELPRELSLYGTSDIALSEGSGNYTVHIVFGVDSAGHVWIIELKRARLSIHNGVDVCLELMKEYKPVKWFFERVGLQKAFGPVLRKSMREESVWTLLEEVSITGLGGKDSPDRAGAFAGAAQMGFIHVPFDAPWLGQFIFELTRFPSTTFDDQVDACALIGMKLLDLRSRKGRATREELTHFKLEETGFTFNDLRDANTRARMGRPRRPGAFVAPFPQTTVLDEEV